MIRVMTVIISIVLSVQAHAQMCCQRPKTLAHLRSDFLSGDQTE